MVMYYSSGNPLNKHFNKINIINWVVPRVMLIPFSFLPPPLSLSPTDNGLHEQAKKGGTLQSRWEGGDGGAALESAQQMTSSISQWPVVDPHMPTLFNLSPLTIVTYMWTYYYLFFCHIGIPCQPVSQTENSAHGLSFWFQKLKVLKCLLRQFKRVKQLL